MKASSDDLRYEDAVERLENIIAEMESGQLSLDASLQKFEEAVRLARICRYRLEEARQRVDILLRDEDGNLFLEQMPQSSDTLFDE
ncbi:MAG: exodeoxyribonuclease VII small subunit [bacterium]|nr:exodeoxyribonuclease VII small subunit [bacterium]